MDKEDTNIVHGAITDVPIYEGSLGQLILENLKKHKHGECMIDAHTGRKITFSWLLHRTIRTAEALKSTGISKGDCISVSSENQLNFYIPVIAAMYLGVTVAPLNHSYTPGELAHTLSFSRPKIIFCASSLAEKYLQLQKENYFLERIVTLESDVKIANIENIEEFMTRSETLLDVYEFETVKLDIVDTVGFIFCSSGTTGLPKGVMLTHHNILAVYANHLDPRFALFHHEKGNTNLGLLPFFHALGFLTVLISIVSGTPIVVIQKFDERIFLRTLQDYKITSAMLVPPIMLFLAKSPIVNEYDLSNFKCITCGAAPVSKELIDEVTKRLKLKDVRQGYGLTEATLAIFSNPPEKGKVGSVGKLVPRMKCKVADMETGNALGPCKPGEICLKGPLIMKGYSMNPESTAATFDKDGWLRTGDVGYYDDGGYFYIIDRIKELIKYKGFQVAPAELEAILNTHPSIKDSAVIGIPDDEAGELPMAFIVKQPGKDITADEVKTFVAKKVSSQKRLHGGIMFVNAIPKNPSGKILRKELKEMEKNKKMPSKL